MVHKVLSTPILYTVSLVFLSVLGFSQESITFKVLRATDADEAILDQHFKAYTVASLGTEGISNLLRSKDYFHEMELKVGDQTFSFNLRSRDLRAPNYKLRAWTDLGAVEQPRSPNKTYYGFTHSGKFDVRITADEDFFYGLIIQENDELYIEPLSYLVPGSAKNQFVIYWGSDNLKKFNHNSCGVHNVQTPYHEPEEDNQHEEFSGRACKLLQIALADDHLMFEQYGSIPEVEEHNLAVINNVETNYDTEFDDDIQFSIVEIFVTTTDGNDPWTNNTDPYALLDDFTDWGPTGFDNTHDVGGLWSNRNFNGDIIGVAWLAAVCTNFRYHVLEDFTSNANLLRVLQAHEMGHNFNANHDPVGSQTIMAPSVNNTNTWSAASISSINNYMDQIGCLGPCSPPQPPVADFEADPTEGCAPLVVSFDDQSTNSPTSWAWTFEGGTPGTSTNQNPIITYNTPGDFNVTLQVSNAQGSNSVTFVNYISVGEDPVADFDYTVDEFGVEFENQSDFASSYLWNFGDGTTSTQTNPFHEYDEDGEYLVTLTASNSCGSDVYSQWIEIITLPFAAFSSDITEGCDPIEVEFINLSSFNADFFSWSFPGGSPPTSSAFEPSIVYEIPGTYNVTLTVYNEAGEDAVTYAGYITVISQPIAEFSYTTNGLQVNFNSLGSVGDDFFWNFDDGHVSTLENPVHTYDEGGVYQVSLNVSNDCGNETLILNVEVTGAPFAAFNSNTQYGCAPLVVQFTNQSGGSPTTFSWIFQGGIPGTSNLPNPVVTYNTPGLYDVQLTVTNASGSDSEFLADYIEVESTTVSQFDFDVNGLIASFTNESSNATGYHWDFGDGTESSAPDPTHVYIQDGTYTVILVSEGICGNDTSTAQVMIQTPPQAGFSFDQMGGCAPATVLFYNESSNNATSFAWSFPGGTPSSSNLENPTITYTNEGVYDVSLIAYSAGGSDTMVWSDLVSVGNIPEASFLLSTSEKTLTLTNLSSDADGYMWLFGDGQSSVEVNPVHTYDAFGIYTLMLIATNECGNDTMDVVIELSTIPNAFFGYNTHSGCAPFEVQFIDQSQNNPTSWLWTFDGGNPHTSNLQHPLVQYTVPGAYFVSLQVANALGSDVLILDALIQVGGVPDATFLHEQNENIISLEYPGLDYDSLLWSFGDGRTDKSLNPTVEYSVSGQYEISLIVYNGCGSDTSSVWVNIEITALNDPEHNKAGWEIRPSPFDDLLTISGHPETDGTVSISLLDLQGKLLASVDWEHASGQIVKEIPADHFPAGLILVVIRDESSRVILKAVHQ